MMTPTVHLNGTSKEDLLEAYCDAIHALYEAGSALAKTYPNGRVFWNFGTRIINGRPNGFVVREQHYDNEGIGIDGPIICVIPKSHPSFLNGYREQSECEEIARDIARAHNRT